MQTASPPVAATPSGLRWSTVATFAAAFAPVVALVATEPASLTNAPVVAALAAGTAFAALWWPRLGAPRLRVLLQAALATAAVAALPFPLANAPTLVLLQVLVAARLPRVVAGGLGGLTLGAQVAALAVIYADRVGGPAYLAAFVLAVGGLQLFAFHLTTLHLREARTSEELRRALVTLEITRSVLAAGERLGERVRIARDLHDSIGHHLTTLSLQLDLARRQPPEAARDTLDTAHTICRLLLTELRDVLQDVRRSDGRELAAALRDVAGRVPTLAVELDLDEQLDRLDPERAHVLLRCGQEFVTNTLRHAHASRLRLVLRRRDGEVELLGEDDGRGLTARRPGGGLDGLEARLTALGGTLTVGAGDGGRGTRLIARLPLAEAAA